VLGCLVAAPIASFVGKPWDAETRVSDIPMAKARQFVM